LIFLDVGATFHYYSLALCVFQYFLPLALMTYFYSMVAATIWRRRDICQVRCESIENEKILIIFEVIN
jgi:hypothetical protein